MTAPVLTTIATSIPGASDALRYLAEKLTAFEATGPRIRQAQHKAAQLSYLAKQAGRVERMGELDAQIYRLGDLAARRQQVAELLQPVTAWLRQNGFGIVLPVVIAVAAVAGVAAVAYVIAQTGIEEQKLDLLAKGILTPEQLAELNASSPALFNFDFGKLVPWLLGVGAVWGIVRLVKGGGGGSRLW